jgi:hypothetical protein
MVDNIAAISTTLSGKLTRQNRHFFAKYYWLHKQLNSGLLDMQYMSTKDQLADILTKPLPFDVITQFNAAIGLY